MGKHFGFIIIFFTGTFLLSWGGGQGWAVPADGTRKQTEQLEKITPADRQAAAERAAIQGFALPTAGTMEMAMPGAVPHYFSHPNYANSPLPFIVMTTVSFTDATGSGATATATVNNGIVTDIIVTNGGSNYSAPMVSIEGSGNGAAGSAVVDATTGAITAITVDAQGSGYDALQGGLHKFVDGLPGLGEAKANNLGQYIPVATPDVTTYPGSDYYEIEVLEYTEKMHSGLPPTTLRGYRQTNSGANPLPHYLGPTIVATKDRPVRILFRNSLPTGAAGNLFLPVDTTVMGAGMGPHMEMMSMDPQNPDCGMLPKPMHCYPENRAELHLHGGISPWISDGTPHQWITPVGEESMYSKGVSVEYVPDMWFDALGKTIASCAGQPTCVVEGATNNPGSAAQTYYYTNQQSARLMFYHDHSWGITRLNVYAGEAAPYLVTDDTEKALLKNGTIPAEQIPLVIQDKTFVPSMEQLAISDETWDIARWGGEGSLWLPHVYSPAQNPGDSSGVNQFGRWAYGPWFWPPTTGITYGPIDNPYYNQNCDPDAGWCEPSLMPGVPFNSMGMEAFMDTPLVNGTAYPTMTVDPKAYRFRILNAANDRFFNLSIYKAVDANGNPCDAAKNPVPAPEGTGVACTEVKLNPAELAAALDDPAGVFPTPVAGMEGPDWIQIGSEGGFLPKPAVIPAHITTWVTDPTVFNAGNVDQHSLLLAPAERADVIVDFSAFAGQTLILYNDAPAAFPARDPRYDYYTGNPDLRETGGTPATLPGYGPNTRTVMQIKVADVEPAPFNKAALDTAFAHKEDGSGVFESGQHPIIVGQGAYNPAYGTSFQSNGPLAGLAQIFDTSLTFKTLLGDTLTVPLRSKMIQDEMGEAFEHEYGRMSGFLGVETANAQAGRQNMILSGYPSPPIEIMKGVQVPKSATGGLQVTPIASADDGTQLWKITHNGVDTHPIHVHMYDFQVINRVGWDGVIRKPEANELGWKDTLRVSPLEDTIVAVRPIVPHVPFDLPNSIRLIDPSMPEGAYLANTTAQKAAEQPLFAFNPDGEAIDVINHFVNFGWEYVWHCHILSHEEMDMMHAQAVGVAPEPPTGLTWLQQGSGGNKRNVLTWMDNSKNETVFVIERSTSATGPWSILATVASDKIATGIAEIDPATPSAFVNGPGTGARTYSDKIGNTKTQYYYQVYAVNTVGDTWDYANPYLNRITKGGFPTVTLDSRGGASSGVVAAASNLTASALIKNNKTATVTLNWTDNASNETGYLIQRADNLSFTVGVVNATMGAGSAIFNQDVTRGKTYYYRVQAFNDTQSSAWSNTAGVTTP